MVISKDAKRKRKDNPPPKSPTEPPKRTKVQAQRKFAQGQGNTSGAFTAGLSVATATPGSASGKESSVPETPPEPIMAKKPRASDFVTYLCYSRTPILSQQLDFLSKNKSPPTPAATAGPSESPAAPPKGTADKVEAGSSREEPKKPKKAPEVKEKQDFIPFGVRKRAEQVPDKKQKTVEALRKKYHDQRVAKLKTKGFPKGNPAISTSIRTRSNPTQKAEEVVEEKKAEKKPKEAKAPQAKRKIALRSSGGVPPAEEAGKGGGAKKDLVKTELPRKKPQPPSRKKVTKKFFKKAAESEGDNGQEVVEEKQPKKGAKNQMSKKEIENLSQTATEGSENDTKATRPTRKTKEAATIYMELIGRKLNLKDSDEEADTSLDSFPELPNVRKTEQMENELKQNVGKNKSQSPEKVTPVKKEQPEKRKRPEAKTPKGAKKSPAKKELEKSFSDSDEEPLAVKIVKKKRPSPKQEKKKVPQLLKDEDLAVFSPPRVHLLPEDQPSPIPECEIPKISPKNDTTDDILNLSFTTFKSPTSIEATKASLPATPEVSTPTTTTKPLKLEELNFTKPLTLLKPKQEVQLIQKTLDQDSRKFEPLPPKKAITASLASTSASKTSAQAIASLMNPLPSKEESGKIFGIASVSLAQSSGPQDTKCTLGKCGSVHKPPLGPAVPTEALLGDSGANRERRKSKVNMSHEQIQKWLIECSKAPQQEEIHDDLSDEDFMTPPKPISYLLTSSPYRELADESTSSGQGMRIGGKGKEERSSSSTTGKSTSATKGPTLKAMPVFSAAPAKEEATPPKEPLNFASIRTEEKKAAPSPAPQRKQPTNRPAKEPAPKKVETSPPKAAVKTPINTPKAPEKAKPTPKSAKPAKSATPAKQVDRRPIYNRKTTPLYSPKVPETSKTKQVVNTFGAFSPENEHSVYSFDKEDDAIPVATPFRRHTRRESNNSRLEDTPATEKSRESGKKDAETSFQKPSPVASASKEVTPQVSFTLSPEENNKSASIAVQVSLDVDQQQQQQPQQPGKVTNEKQTSTADGNDSDSEGHTFYIPLQGAGNLGGKGDQLIQGVAVKLGTEGPDGPNQRVIMRAKLVTKAQMGTNPTPIPESLANAQQDIMKSLLANKEICSKSVPIGTVQPRFKSSAATETPTTSRASASRDPPPAQSAASSSRAPSHSSLTRVNSNSSLVSQKSRKSAKGKTTATEWQGPVQPSNNTAFPRTDDAAQMVEAPVFSPTEKEFQDPIEFIDRIAPIAARFGLCRIIPPASFKPECRVSDDMRFTAYNQYVHKMLHRWGPSAKELSAIKKYLATQSITLTHPPWIGGMEVDLPRLYHTVQELGGLKEVIEKKKWARVAEEMCIPKSAQDRVTKLDDIYCKYLLPYDTLSPAERQKLFDEVEADWAKREAKARRNADRCVTTAQQHDAEGSNEDDEEDESEDEADGAMECIEKGRSMPLNAFFRIARNTMALWFKNSEPSPADVEAEFWRHVAVRDSHVCVHSGSIDSSGWGYGFPAPGAKAKASPCARHPWNLKVLTNNCGSILRSLGPVMGVTVPTLHVGMLFSACCWYRDPHGLPWIEYLHTGAPKVWYGVPDEQSSNFRTALTSLVPTHCQNKTIWLPSDTAMVPPHMLTDKGVSLCRTEQQPGQFVVIFPRAYTSSIATGYVISESVYFATHKWLDSSHQDFKDIQESCEPTMFSLEQLVFAIASDQRSNVETLVQILPLLTEVSKKEANLRQELKDAGVTTIGKFATKTKKTPADENECDLCRANLFVSLVKTEIEEEEITYCLEHGLKYIQDGEIVAKQCTLMQRYTIPEIEQLIGRLKERIEQQSCGGSSVGSRKSGGGGGKKSTMSVGSN
uniref:Protein Jumonji n=2 Tax=Lutzomyia longipalpis TaxID=7200 RepID=A0A1B0CKP7_LUTLO